MSQRGFVLLQLIRAYLEMDMYMSLTVHTEETLEAAEKQLLRFGEVMQVSSNLIC